MSESIIFFRVIQIVLERADVKTFVLENIDGSPVPYKAGQFLTFITQVHDQEIRRSYSISSAPEVDPYLAITVKRISNGEISRMWTDHIKVGDVVKSLPPSGRFTIDPTEGSRRDIVLIGAGSGITPLYAILKSILHREPESCVTLVYANQNEHHTLFFKQITDLESQYSDRLNVIHIHSRPSDDWQGLRGRLNNSRLETLLDQYIRFKREDARFFLCGPSELMRTTDITLRYLGFTDHQIRKENFVIENVLPPLRPSEPHVIEIDWQGRKINLPVNAHETILDAALRQGVKLPYSCKGGRCSTCAVICTRGKVFLNVNEVLTDRDVAEGWILTCSGYPDSDDVQLRIE
jgi:ring-1,2-phenylacetyl-CoA epoxidase subunit PaaE